MDFNVPPTSANNLPISVLPVARPHLGKYTCASSANSLRPNIQPGDISPQTAPQMKEKPAAATSKVRAAWRVLRSNSPCAFGGVLGWAVAAVTSGFALWLCSETGSRTLDLYSRRGRHFLSGGA